MNCAECIARVTGSFSERLRGLMDNGVDLLVFETYAQSDELECAIRAARNLDADMPVFARISVDAEGNLPFGPSIKDAVRMLVDAGASVMGFNCGVGPQQMLNTIKKFKKHLAVPILVQPNAGLPREVDGRTMYMSTPEYFAAFTTRFLEEGVQFIGGCCGAFPRHICAMAQAMRQYRAMRSQVSSALEPAADMLGIQAIGLRNVLVITGDPLKLGDYPEATGAFDVDSVGLVRMTQRFDGGTDLGGRPIGVPSAFSLGVVSIQHMPTSRRRYPVSRGRPARAPSGRSHSPFSTCWHCSASCTVSGNTPSRFTTSWASGLPRACATSTWPSVSSGGPQGHFRAMCHHRGQYRCNAAFVQ